LDSNHFVCRCNFSQQLYPNWHFCSMMPISPFTIQISVQIKYYYFITYCRILLEKIKKWREANTASLFGCLSRSIQSTLWTSHYKFNTHLQQFLKFQEQQHAISTFIVQTLNFCINTDYVLDHQKQVVNTIILKDL
jgi:hypothetical protein